MFLLHTNPNIIQNVYTATVANIYSMSDNILLGCLSVLGFVVGVFVLAILLDQIRIFFWKIFWGKSETLIRKAVNIVVELGERRVH